MVFPDAQQALLKMGSGKSLLARRESRGFLYRDPPHEERTKFHMILTVIVSGHRRSDSGKPPGLRH